MPAAAIAAEVWGKCVMLAWVNIWPDRYVGDSMGQHLSLVINAESI
jgi:hypothetical protein